MQDFLLLLSMLDFTKNYNKNLFLFSRIGKPMRDFYTHVLHHKTAALSTYVVLM